MSNSAYARIKVFCRPVVVKMLVNSGNLVHDLMSEEFAKLAQIRYQPSRGRWEPL